MQGFAFATHPKIITMIIGYKICLYRIKKAKISCYLLENNIKLLDFLQILKALHKFIMLLM